MEYTSLQFELLSPLHVGSGRSGMVARTRHFVPGHVVSNAIAAAVGKALGARREDFEAALNQVCANLRCGPLFILDGDNGPLFPRAGRGRSLAGEAYLTATTHATLDLDSRSAVDSALYEVEIIAPRVLSGKRRGEPTRLGGGIWSREKTISGRPLTDWLGECLLGGELKSGFGRVRLIDWAPGHGDYQGVGRATGEALELPPGEVLPGPTLDGVKQASLEPWIGRRHDPEHGFGRRFSNPVLVRMDGRAAGGCRFIPSDQEAGLGCWVPAEK